VATYEELYLQFAAWHTALTQYEQHAALIMLDFFAGFCQYLGLDANTDRVTLHKIDPRLERPQKHIKVDHFASALSQDNDGSWRFGITVTVQDPNPSPSSPFVNLYFDILFTLRDNECEFQNADDRTKSFPFKCEFGDDGLSLRLQGTQEAYEYLSSVPESLFRLEPWNRPEKIAIGIDLTPRKDR
jgi:hypothetical protein